jgi:hypothetical protein
MGGAFAILEALSLTPALSRWERENRTQHLAKSAAALAEYASKLSAAPLAASLSQRERD